MWFQGIDWIYPLGPQDMIEANEGLVVGIPATKYVYIYNNPGGDDCPVRGLNPRYIHMHAMFYWNKWGIGLDFATWMFILGPTKNMGYY